jgi:MoaA/NifB/PqqE/SkfB family radical SAM enzyme
VSDTLDSLRDAGTTRGVFFSGGGEPLLWPHIGRGIHNASSFADVSIQTNGISLNKLLREGEEGDVAIEHVRLLSLSLFGHTPELHQQVAGVRSSERIIRNIKEVVAYRDDHDLNLTIMAKILVDRHNYPYLSDIVKFYHDIGAPVSLRAVQDFNYGTDDARPQSVELLAEEKREAVRLIRESPYQHQVLRNFASLLMVQQARPTPTEQCYNATDGHFACIDAHGDVYIGNPEIGDVEYRIGSLAVRSWREIWGSDLHREVIKKMSDRQRASLCSSELCRHALANAGVQRYRAGLVGAPNNEAVLDNLGAFL